MQSTVNIHRRDEDGFTIVIRTRTFTRADGERGCRIDYPFADDHTVMNGRFRYLGDFGDLLNYFGNHYGRNEIETHSHADGYGWTIYKFERNDHNQS